MSPNNNNNTLVVVAIAWIAIAIASKTVVGAFHSHIPRIHELHTIMDTKIQPINNNHHNNKRQPATTTRERNRVILYGWMKDAFQSLGLDITAEQEKYNSQPLLQKDAFTVKSTNGTVVRTAAKAYHKDTSTPSSKFYTTRKDSAAAITIRPDGVQGDYNHYRAVALSSTPDRAVSIWTSDVLTMLHAAGWNSVQQGDLGENILVDGIDYTFFQIGQRYKFQTKLGSSSSSSDDNDDEEDGIIVEITERVEPCGNLCKLAYINDDNLAPKDRLEACKRFLLWLNERDGLRGWYAKVIGEGGMVKLGDQVTAIAV